MARNDPKLSLVSISEQLFGLSKWIGFSAPDRIALRLEVEADLLLSYWLNRPKRRSGRRRLGLSSIGNRRAICAIAWVRQKSDGGSAFFL